MVVFVSDFQRFVVHQRDVHHVQVRMRIRDDGALLDVVDFVAVAARPQGENKEARVCRPAEQLTMSIVANDAAACASG